MALTWENRVGSRLTSHGYGQSGGISRAVQVSADAVYDSLSAGQQELARDLLRLMTVADRDGRLTRRPLTRSDLYAGTPSGEPGQVNAVLEAFAARRLIVLDADRAQICHDALLSAWPRLRTWLEEDQASWILHGQLADDAAAWHERHGDPSFLYRGTQLNTVQQAATRWSTGPGRSPVLSTTQEEFLRASHRAAARQTRRRRSRVGVLALLTVAALIASAFAFQQRSRELWQRNQAIYNEVSAEALQASAADPSLAAELTLADYRMQPTPDLASQLITTENTPLSTPLTTHSNNPVESVAFSPDRRTLASVNINGTVRLWDVSNLQHPRPLGQLVADGGIGSLAFSPDGRTLAGGGSPNTDGEGAIWLWDVSTPAHPRPLGQPLSPNGKPLSRDDGSDAESVAFSPNGRILASGGSVYKDTGSNIEINENTIQLWDVSSPEHPRPLGQRIINGSSYFDSLAFSPDSHTLASSETIGTADSTVQLWNVSNTAHPQPLRHSLASGNGHGFDSVAFSQSGILAAGGNRGAIRLWGVADPAHPRPLGQLISSSSGQPVDLVAFSPDGHTLADDSNGTIQLWNVANPAEPQLISQPLSGSSNGGVNSLAFSPDGRTLASGEANGTIQLWNIPPTILTGNGSISSIAFSPDGHILASANNGAVQLWDVANPLSARPLGQLPKARKQRVVSLAFSPDSKILAARELKGHTGTVQLWNIANPARPQQVGHTLTGAGYFGINSFAFKPDSRMLAIGEGDGTIQLWNTDPSHPHPGSQIQAGFDESLGISSIAFSPNGHILASIDYTGSIEFWSAADYASQMPIGVAQIAQTASAFAVGVKSMVYSPDGRTLTLLNGDGTIELWDVAHPAHPKRLGQLPTLADGLFSSIAFSPQGALSTGDDDGTIQLWSTASPAHPKPDGKPIATSSQVTSVAFSPDGTLASGTSAGTILLWNLHVDDAIKRICATAKNNLTPQKWHHYISQLPYQAPC